MKTTLGLLIIITLSFCSTMKAKAQSTNTALTAKTFKWNVSRAGEMQYLSYVPKGYSAKDGKRWPLILFLHGAGERGTDVQRVAIHGPPKLVKQGRNFPSSSSRRSARRANSGRTMLCSSCWTTSRITTRWTRTAFISRA